MNISIPKPMRAWVEEQVAKGRYGTASEFIRRLLHDEQKRRLRKKIDAKLLVALASGPATPMTAKDWEDIGREGRKRLATLKKRAR